MGPFVSVLSFRSFDFGPLISVLSFRSFSFGRFLSVLLLQGRRFVAEGVLLLRCIWAFYFGCFVLFIGCFLVIKAFYEPFCSGRFVWGLLWAVFNYFFGAV